VHHQVPIRQHRRTRTANLLENLIVVCPTCHRKTDGPGSEDEKVLPDGEPDALKGAHPVRTGVSGDDAARAANRV
jgi:5-methylcytosine-specific restriction endonuclease McrA